MSTIIGPRPHQVIHNGGFLSIKPLRLGRATEMFYDTGTQVRVATMMHGCSFRGRAYGMPPGGYIAAALEHEQRNHYPKDDPLTPDRIDRPEIAGWKADKKSNFIASLSELRSQW